MVFLWIHACFIAFFALGNVPLRDFDEGIVARVALELSQKNGIDRLLPSLWGQPYLNKPPGLHWLISVAIQLGQRLKLDLDGLPNELTIRFIPALMSTFVVPLGGLIQWYLSPSDRVASIASSSILLTLLPVARHGRLAMLDGTQLSAIALLWLFLVSLNRTKSDKYRFLGAGFVCSYMLLLKAPLIIPALLAAFLSLMLTGEFKYQCKWFLFNWFFIGLIPGISWHIWNAISYGYGALWLWWGDGAGRVLFHSGSGSDLGVLVPLIEVIEGGWPWLLLWPFGILWALNQFKTRWGIWAFTTQLVIIFSILPLKMQLPWYSHPFWLPFSLLCAPPYLG